MAGIQPKKIKKRKKEEKNANSLSWVNKMIEDEKTKSLEEKKTHQD